MTNLTVPEVVLTGELEEYRKQLEALNEGAHTMLAHLTPGQLFWRPAAESWSIGECLAHVAVVNRAMLPGIDLAIASGRRKGLHGAGPFHHGWPGGWLLKTLEPPVSRRVKTAPWALPPAQGTAGSVEAELRASHAEMIERMRRAQGLHLGKVKVKSPFLPLLRYTLGQAFAICAAHGRRHLWQAEQVRGNPGFPGSG